MLGAGLTAGGLGIGDPRKAVVAGGFDHGVLAAFGVANSAFFMLGAGLTAGGLGIGEPFPCVGKHFAGEEGMRIVMFHLSASGTGIIVFRLLGTGSLRLQRRSFHISFTVMVRAGGFDGGILVLFCMANRAFLMLQPRIGTIRFRIRYPVPAVCTGSCDRGIFISPGMAYRAFFVLHTGSAAGSLRIGDPCKAVCAGGLDRGVLAASGMAYRALFMLHTGSAAGRFGIGDPCKAVCTGGVDRRILIAFGMANCAFLMLHAGDAAGGFGIGDPCKAVCAGGVDRRILAAFGMANSAFLMFHTGGAAGGFGIRYPFPAVLRHTAGCKGMRIVMLNNTAEGAGIVIYSGLCAGCGRLERIFTYRLRGEIMRYRYFGNLKLTAFTGTDHKPGRLTRTGGDRFRFTGEIVDMVFKHIAGIAFRVANGFYRSRGAVGIKSGCIAVGRIEVFADRRNACGDIHLIDPRIFEQPAVDCGKRLRQIHHHRGAPIVKLIQPQNAYTGIAQIQIFQIPRSCKRLP